MNVKSYSFKMTTHNITQIQQAIQTEREWCEVESLLYKIRTTDRVTPELLNEYVRENVHYIRSVIRELELFCDKNEIDLSRVIAEDDNALHKRGYFNQHDRPKHEGCRGCEHFEKGYICSSRPGHILSPYEVDNGCGKHFKRAIPHGV